MAARLGCPMMHPSSTPFLRLLLSLITWTAVALQILPLANATQGEPQRPWQGDTPLDAAVRQCNQAWQRGNSYAKTACSAVLDQANKLPDSDPQKARALSQTLPSVERDDDANLSQTFGLFRRVLALDERNLGPDDPEVAFDLSGLAGFYVRAKRPAEAEKLYKRAATIADSAQKMNCFMRTEVFASAAGFYRLQKRYAEAEAMMKRAVELASGLPPQQQSFFINFRAELADILRQEGKESEADRLLAEPVDPDHGSNTTTTASASMVPYNDYVRGGEYVKQGKLKEAELFFRQAIAALDPASGEGERAPMLEAQVLNELGDLCHSQHRDAEAEELLLRALDLREKTIHRDGDKNSNLAVSLSNLNGLLNFYRDQGRLSAMEPIYQRILGLQERYPEPTGSALFQTLFSFAMLYQEENRFEEALPLYRRALRIQEKNVAPDDPQLLVILQPYSEALDKLGKTAEADSVRARLKQLRNQE